MEGGGDGGVGEGWVCVGVVLRQLKDFSGSFKGCQVIRSLPRKVFSGWLVELTLVKCVSDNIAGVALVSVSLSNKPHVVLIFNIFIFYQLELLDRRS